MVSVSLATKAFLKSSSTSTRAPAEQVWPKFCTMALTTTGIAALRSASANTICGDLPPSSKVQPPGARPADRHRRLLRQRGHLPATRASSTRAVPVSHRRGNGEGAVVLWWDRATRKPAIGVLVHHIGEHLPKTFLKDRKDNYLGYDHLQAGDGADAVGLRAADDGLCRVAGLDAGAWRAVPRQWVRQT